jgi:hypothetical protein
MPGIVTGTDFTWGGMELQNFSIEMDIWKLLSGSNTSRV